MGHLEVRQDLGLCFLDLNLSLIKWDPEPFSPCRGYTNKHAALVKHLKQGGLGKSWDRFLWQDWHRVWLLALSSGCSPGDTDTETLLKHWKH